MLEVETAVLMGVNTRTLFTGEGFKLQHVQVGDLFFSGVGWGARQYVAQHPLPEF